jgi:hypothetical protein
MDVALTNQKARHPRVFWFPQSIWKNHLYYVKVQSPASFEERTQQQTSCGLVLVEAAVEFELGPFA